ncbi:MAG: AAA family ATPase [Dehalococcoidales bacterium]|jgi:predicted kinase|nr:AAA family ATPase [Dehalococcoidales bacterium]
MENAQLAADVERLAESLGQLPEPVAKPTLVAVSGLPGTGKSYFSTRLAERLPFVILESDALRKILFPCPTYSAEESTRLFRVVHCLIERLLKRGIPVILDATNLSERHREYLYSIVEHRGVKLVLVRVEAPPELVAGRLHQRQEIRESKSDADWMVYQRMRSSVEEIQRRHYAVDTSRDITPVLDKIVKEVTR